MHEELWAGVELKLQNAWFHYHRMGRSLEPPKPTATNVALEAAGAIIDTNWQEAFYAHFDAFLSATRSVAEIIKCCFGVDNHPKMKDFLNSLPAGERERRDEFCKQFQTHYDCFCRPPLGEARHISEHRTGYAPVTVKISGFFGVTYTGGPAQRVPISEARQIDDPKLAWMARSHPSGLIVTTSTLEGGVYFLHVRNISMVREPSRIKRAAFQAKCMALTTSPTRRPRPIT
ncbi:MAG: hypothetical protein ACR2KT_17585 [Methylocella sp.]|nr:MAG: hypothetical protein DLM68_13550 [Hyphomicrobiales bacterium]